MATLTLSAGQLSSELSISNERLLELVTLYEASQVGEVANGERPVATTDQERMDNFLHWIGRLVMGEMRQARKQQLRQSESDAIQSEFAEDWVAQNGGGSAPTP
jgi:oligoribonuclease (3'-5' exoribonuclease)